VSQVRQLNPDLVFSTCLEDNLQQTPGLGRVEHPVGQTGLPPSGDPLFQDAGGPFASVLQSMNEAPLTRQHPALDDGQVVFRGGSRPELFAQSGGGFGCAGEKKDSGYGAVQAMHHAQKDSTRPGILRLEPSFGEFQQAGVAGLVPLHQKARRLVEGQEMIVEMKDRPVVHEERAAGRKGCADHRGTSPGRRVFRDIL